MAFTNSPQNQTYKTVNIPFNGVELFRSGDLTNTRDLQIVNAYYDRVTQENQKRTVALKKRPGLIASSYTLNKNASTDAVRGSWYDVEQNAMYWAVNNHVYKVKPDVSSTPTLVTTLNTSSGYVGFCNFLKSTNTRYVCFSDGTDLWIEDYVAVTCNRVVDPDFPTPHQPYPIFLDAYIFLVKAGTNDLYSSVVDDPTSWDPLDVISAEINADLSIRPIKVKNYLVVLGYRSLEYFYDASNATDSPLSRNDSPYRAIGYVTGGCSISDTTYFVGQDNNQNMSVYTVNSFKVDQISNAVVDSTLQTFSSTSNTKGQVFLNKDGFSISVDGHDFYVLPTTQTTWVYDIDEKFWYEWKGSDGNALIIEAAWSMYNGSQYVAIKNQSTISVFSPSVYQDFGVNFTLRYTTDNVYADTFMWKNCYRLSLICDLYTMGVVSNLQLTWSDNDWADGGSGITKNINVMSSNSYCRGLGRFRTRSWRFSYTDNYPLRLNVAMMDINVGTN